jgi:hypothetical protein
MQINIHISVRYEDYTDFDTNQVALRLWFQIIKIGLSKLLKGVWINSKCLFFYL